MLLEASPVIEESVRVVLVARSAHRYMSHLVLRVYLRVVLRVCSRRQGDRQRLWVYSFYRNSRQVMALARG